MPIAAILMAVELHSWFAKELGAEAAVFDIMGSGSIRRIGGGCSVREPICGK